tara:strand:- start:1928 stop:4294 length:2367 start_codon:yes stop_codon:yes gene_type:complete
MNNNQIENNLIDLIDYKVDYKKEFFKYYHFVKWFILSVISFLIIAFIYLRYCDYLYFIDAKIEIIDKAQDSEMALPTAMTIFNRSMINLENEKGVLNSYILHKRVNSRLKSNVKYFAQARVRANQMHKSSFFDDYSLTFNIDTDTVFEEKIFSISTLQNNKLKIIYENEDEQIEYIFENSSTYSSKHSLPFDITINNPTPKLNRIIQISPFDETIEQFRSDLSIEITAEDSDQLVLSMRQNNPEIAEEYINTIIAEFDKDGVEDRRLEYKRTIDFVDSRSQFLINELEQVELRKLNFKKTNKLVDLESDASFRVSNQLTYNSELFAAESQKDLSEILKESLNESQYELLPVNIGVESESVNSIISDYNLLVKERESYLLSAGPNNSLVKSIEKQLNSFFNNIIITIENYQRSLDVKISNLQEKEREFASVYDEIPENEKILRSIERELEIKEALFVLLLQKREEAAINFSVIKPSIKVIDYARSSIKPVYPNKLFVIIIAILVGFIVPFVILYVMFLYDDKIQTTDDLNGLNAPIIGEIPFISNLGTLDPKALDRQDRSPIVESMRMAITNLTFSFNENLKKESKSILITSSIKGEGKTLVSYYFSKVLSFTDNNRVILIGADLRNPQIHKFLGLTLNDNPGLSDYIYKNDIELDKIIHKSGDLDILLAGRIAPNPVDLLSSRKYADLIFELKKKYDYVIIDSAPCLLLSDTLQFSKNIDYSLIVMRANHTPLDIKNYVKDLIINSKINNTSVILNGIGSNNMYSYSYSYKYGYKYNYRYDYDYKYDE